MNSLNTPSVAVEPAKVDPIEFSQLDKKPRFPIDAWDWDEPVLLPDRPIPKIVGGHTYDLVINRKARRPATRTMHKLLVTFRADFDKASKFFQPEQWRLLYYLEQYSLSDLSNPSFDAGQAFQQFYLLEPLIADVPQEWTGSTKRSLHLLSDMRADMSKIGADVAKAAWAIVSFARALNLEKNEVLQVPWWEVWWIERCIAAYQTRR